VPVIRVQFLQEQGDGVRFGAVSAGGAPDIDSGAVPDEHRQDGVTQIIEQTPVIEKT